MTQSTDLKTYRKEYLSEKEMVKFFEDLSKKFNQETFAAKIRANSKTITGWKNRKKVPFYAKIILDQDATIDQLAAKYAAKNEQYLKLLQSVQKLTSDDK
jgi:hypothetical protein